jgi:hypothetical protein
VPQYEVLMQWLCEGYVTVEARSRKEAAEAAWSCDLPEGSFVKDSVEVREDVVLLVGRGGGAGGG